MTDRTKHLILAGLTLLRGDNYARAKAAFRDCTPEQMQQVWTGNGETRHEVLDAYRRHSEAVDAAIAEVNAVPVTR